MGLHGRAGTRSVDEPHRLATLERKARRAGVDCEAHGEGTVDVDQLLFEQQLLAGAVEQIEGGSIRAQRARP